MTLTPSGNAREDRGAASLARELEAARRDALRAIEVLAEQYAQVMSDSELVSVFVSCCTKDVRKSLVSFLAQCLKDRAAKGALDITMSDGIALFNASKDYAVPKEALSVLFAQFESSPFRDCKEPRSGPGGAGKSASGSGPKSLQGQGATKEWRSSVSRATLCEIGRLCRSLYHLECNERLLRNLDNALNFSLNSPNFCSRICSRNRSGNHGLNSAVLAVSSIVHLLARNNYRNNQSVERLLLVLPAVPWNYDAQDELVLLVDLCWSLLSLRIEAWRVSAHLDKLFERLPLLPLKHCVKLLGGLYHSVGGSRQYLESPSSCERVPMDDLLAYTLNDGESSHVRPLGGGVASKRGGGRVDPDYEDVSEYLHALRSLYMGRIEVGGAVLLGDIVAQEVTDIQGLSNFMFYAAATLEDLTHDDYNLMCRRWLEISRGSGFRVKVEALSQVLWALQKNRIYHEALLFRVRDIVTAREAQHLLAGAAFADDPHLLDLQHQHAPADGGAAAQAGGPRGGPPPRALRRPPASRAGRVGPEALVGDLVDRHVGLHDAPRHGVRARVGAAPPRQLAAVRAGVPAPGSAQGGRRRGFGGVHASQVLQMYTSLEVELPRAPGYVASESHCHLIPDYVISAAIRDSTSVSSVAPISASQDKARRSLMSFGVRFKGEYEVYHGIVVDFAVTRNREPEDFVPHLVIEIDGPHHYNVICDEYVGPALQVLHHLVERRGALARLLLVVEERRNLPFPEVRGAFAVDEQLHLAGSGRHLGGQSGELAALGDGDLHQRLGRVLPVQHLEHRSLPRGVGFVPGDFEERGDARQDDFCVGVAVYTARPTLLRRLVVEPADEEAQERVADLCVV
ncbi:uncharacterized protein BcabD6B2_55400 [Babesia caballi]|uniref:RAP domain-containing protein n=1 Tax=Babesia caballi TaxID=5871 RepID=A0AAV4M5K4_BABCB|nr:hypothetical protein, conserved [Babesia caballi]